MDKITKIIGDRLRNYRLKSKISQETLMSTYYGVPIRTGLFKSKFRPDSNPTVCYYKNSTNKIIVKDFGSDFCGD